MPITLVDRARAQLRRFFSEGRGRSKTTPGCRAVVGPGEGWTEEDLAPGIRLGYGWRGGTFKVEVAADDARRRRRGRRRTTDEPRRSCPRTNARSATRSKKFVVIETGRNPAELRFATGPGGTGAVGRVHARRTRQLGRGRRVVSRVPPTSNTSASSPASVSVAVGDAGRAGATSCCTVFDTITDRVRAAARHPARPATRTRGRRDRRARRRRTRATSRASSTRRTSPDAAFRCLAVGQARARRSARRRRSRGRARSKTRRARCGAPRSARWRTSRAPDLRAAVRTRARRQGRVRALLRAARPRPDRRRPGRPERRSAASATTTSGCGFAAQRRPRRPRPPVTVRTLRTLRTLRTFRGCVRGASVRRLRDATSLRGRCHTRLSCCAA